MDCTARWVPLSISICGVFVSKDKIRRRTEDEPAVGIFAVVIGVVAAAAGF